MRNAINKTVLLKCIECNKSITNKLWQFCSSLLHAQVISMFSRWGLRNILYCQIQNGTEMTSKYFVCKVHIFWESHKILWNLHLTFDWYYMRPSQNIWTSHQIFDAFPENFTCKAFNENRRRPRLRKVSWASALKMVSNCSFFRWKFVAKYAFCISFCVA